MDPEQLRMHVDLLAKFDASLSELTLDELVVLNKLVVQRIKDKEDMGYRQASSGLRIGHQVKWAHEGRTYLGKIQKINKKTIQVIDLSPPHGQWKIAPQYLTVVPKT